MFKGDGLLALWNGVDPERAAEYDLWHSREHVPERVGVPGILSARRYVDGDGPLPRYLTLYDLRSLDVLASPAYRALLDGPTPWSRSMRHSFRGFFRLACRPLARAGSGLAGAALATTLDLAVIALPTAEDLAELLRGALAIPAITAAQFAVVAPEIPNLPFQIGGDLPNYPRDAVLILESYDRATLVAAMAAIEHWRRASVFGPARTVWTSYALGYVVAADDLPDLVLAARQPGPARA